MIKLKEKYKKETAPEMIKRFGIKNKMAVPKIKKVVVNVGIGRLLSLKTGDEKKKAIDKILTDLALICAQKPVLTKAKKSISGFKLREGMPVGAKVTLRGKKMYDFMEKIIHIALPRLRDFRGIDLKHFDKDGNLTLSFREQTVFPEIIPEKSKIIFGLEITIVTSAHIREQGIELLRLLGFPIKNG